MQLVCLGTCPAFDRIEGVATSCRVLRMSMCGLQFGYTTYRRVLAYYSGEEDALDMRKAMTRDVHRLSVVPLKRPIHPHELEHD